MLGWAWIAVLAAALPIRQANVDDVARALRTTEGRPRIVHLWASWCVPCVVELPHLVATLRDAEKRGVDVVLLSLDNAEGEKTAAQMLRKAGGPVDSSGGMNPPASSSEARRGPTPLWLCLRAESPRAIAAVRDLDGEWDGSIPTTYLLGKDGKLALAQRGGTDLAQLAAELDRIAPGRKRTNRRTGK